MYLTTNTWHTQWVLGFVIDYAGIFKLCVTRHLHGGRESWTVLEKVILQFLLCFLRLRGKLSDRCFVGFRSALCLHANLSFKCGKEFFRISSIRKNAVTWISAGVFAYLLSFFSQILDFIYCTVLISIYFYFDLFWVAWRWKYSN